MLSHKRMQAEKQGKQDLKTFGIATLPRTFVSLKCDQFMCLPCYLFSLAPGAVWSWGLLLWVLTSALQFGGKHFGSAHICIFWCGLGVSPFMQIIATFTTVSFYVCLKREWENAESLNLKQIPACVTLEPPASVGGWSSSEGEELIGEEFCNMLETVQ